MLINDRKWINPLIEKLNSAKQTWLSDIDFKILWNKEQHGEGKIYYPLDLNFSNISPELAMKIISYIAAYFLPVAKKLYVVAELLQEFEGGYQWVYDFEPDDDEIVTVTEE